MAWKDTHPADEGKTDGLDTETAGMIAGEERSDFSTEVSFGGSSNSAAGYISLQVAYSEEFLSTAQPTVHEAATRRPSVRSANPHSTFEIPSPSSVEKPTYLPKVRTWTFQFTFPNPISPSVPVATLNGAIPGRPGLGPMDIDPIPEAPLPPSVTEPTTYVAISGASSVQSTSTNLDSTSKTTLSLPVTKPTTDTTTSGTSSIQSTNPDSTSRAPLSLEEPIPTAYATLLGKLLPMNVAPKPGGPAFQPMGINPIPKVTLLPPVTEPTITGTPSVQTTGPVSTSQSTSLDSTSDIALPLSTTKPVITETPSVLGPIFQSTSLDSTLEIPLPLSTTKPAVTETPSVQTTSPDSTSQSTSIDSMSEVPLSPSVPIPTPYLTMPGRILPMGIDSISGVPLPPSVQSTNLDSAPQSTSLDLTTSEILSPSMTKPMVPVTETSSIQTIDRDPISHSTNLVSTSEVPLPIPVQSTTPESTSLRSTSLGLASEVPLLSSVAKPTVTITETLSVQTTNPDPISQTTSLVSTSEVRLPPVQSKKLESTSQSMSLVSTSDVPSSPSVTMLTVTITETPPVQTMSADPTSQSTSLVLASNVPLPTSVIIPTVTIARTLSVESTNSDPTSSTRLESTSEISPPSVMKSIVTITRTPSVQSTNSESTSGVLLSSLVTHSTTIYEATTGTRSVQSTNQALTSEASLSPSVTEATAATSSVWSTILNSTSENLSHTMANTPLAGVSSCTPSPAQCPSRLSFPAKSSSSASDERSQTLPYLVPSTLSTSASRIVQPPTTSVLPISNQSPEDRGSHLKTTLAIAIPVAVAGVVIIAGILFFLWRRRRRQGPSPASEAGISRAEEAGAPSQNPPKLPFMPPQTHSNIPIQGSTPRKPVPGKSQAARIRVPDMESRAGKCLSQQSSSNLLAASAVPFDFGLDNGSENQPSILTGSNLNTLGWNESTHDGFLQPVFEDPRDDISEVSGVDVRDHGAGHHHLDDISPISALSEENTEPIIPHSALR